MSQKIFMVTNSVYNEELGDLNRYPEGSNVRRILFVRFMEIIS